MNKRAITPEDKKIIIDRLYACWLKIPDERLGQLIWNSYGRHDFFYVEDEDFVEHLENRK